MLTFGCLFIAGDVVSSNVVDLKVLSTAGWLLIGLSVPLFVLETAYKKRRH